MKSVLLVHDLQESPWERKQQLEAAGFHVDLAVRGEVALERAERSRPDLVLMDVLLEGANGFEVCRELRRHHLAQDLPIVLTSRVYLDERFVEEARAAGAQEYIRKPIPLTQLIERILTVLAAQGGAPVEPMAPALPTVSEPQQIS